MAPTSFVAQRCGRAATSMFRRRLSPRIWNASFVPTCINTPEKLLNRLFRRPATHAIVLAATAGTLRVLPSSGLLTGARLSPKFALFHNRILITGVYLRTRNTAIYHDSAKSLWGIRSAAGTGRIGRGPGTHLHREA